MGYKATHLSKLEIFMLVLEHEMVHGITQIYCQEDMCPNEKV